MIAPEPFLNIYYLGGKERPPLLRYHALNSPHLALQIKVTVLACKRIKDYTYLLGYHQNAIVNL